MSQFASQHEKHLRPASPVSTEKERSRHRVGRHRKAKREGQREFFSRPGNLIFLPETPLGAIHVDARGTVLEHRQPEAQEWSPARSVVGQQIRSIAPWASQPNFLTALESAIESSRLSFHLDFKTAPKPLEREIHVNILAVGDRTVWIFISDKTLALIS
jgi:hypothetical protein